MDAVSSTSTIRPPAAEEVISPKIRHFVFQPSNVSSSAQLSRVSAGDATQRSMMNGLEWNGRAIPHVRVKLPNRLCAPFPFFWASNEAP